MKRLLPFILAVLMAVSLIPALPSAAAASVWDGSVSTTLSGSGTESDPFLVSSGADLAYIAQCVNGALTIKGVSAQTAFYK